MTCEKCGATLAVGDYPFCPHGSTRVAVHSDDVPGGFWAENGFDEPRKFYSRSEHARALAERGMTIAAKWAGPNDKHLKRWDAPCQYTLDAARALLSRVPKSSREAQDDTSVAVTWERTTGERFAVGAK